MSIQQLTTTKVPLMSQSSNKVRVIISKSMISRRLSIQTSPTTPQLLLLILILKGQIEWLKMRCRGNHSSPRWRSLRSRRPRCQRWPCLSRKQEMTSYVYHATPRSYWNETYFSKNLARVDPSHLSRKGRIQIFPLCELKNLNKQLKKGTKMNHNRISHASRKMIRWTCSTIRSWYK